MYYGNSVTIILLVWTCVSASDISQLRCPPAPSNCTIAHPTYWKKSVALFNLDSLPLLTVTSKTPNKIEYICSQLLGNGLAKHFQSFPKFDDVLDFKSVSLIDCGLPQEPYGKILDALNITGFHHLQLRFNSCDPKLLLPTDLFFGLRSVLNLDVLFTSCRPVLNFNFLKYLGKLKTLKVWGVFVPPLPSWNQLQSVSMTYGSPSKMGQQWGGCKVLEKIKVEGWKVIELPEGWLANCTRLISVHIENFEILKNLPNHMFNSTYLHTMKLINCNISYLPNDLFDHARNIRILDLSMNTLFWLSSNTFSRIPFLQLLDLSGNKLDQESVVSLMPLEFLKRLILDGNLYFKTGCEVKLYENEETGERKRQWPRLPSLELLSLDGTYVTRICSYWNQSMPKLKHLNLAETAIVDLQYDDIELIRSSGWNVDLRLSKLQAIVFTKRDYENVLKSSSVFSNASILIDCNINRCDYRWHWFIRTVIERPGYVSLPGLSCDQQGNKLANTVLKNMTQNIFICAEDDCEPGCQCFKRVHDNTTQVNCTGAGLDHIPRVPSVRELHLAYNNIRTINAYDLPETLEYMDLQNNQLSTLDTTTAAMMFNRSTIIYNLGNNRIMCDCNNSALINILQTHKDQLENYDILTCADGSPLQHANTFTLCFNDRMPVITGILTVTLMGLIVMALYFRCRTQIHVVLYAWGWCACCVNEQELDKNKKYDVFISFAHEDTNFVMDELLPELEKKPHAFSVCVHHRDWMPGEWIPTQIAHSVQQSRRTVIVLSRNFLSSVWALLEFRTAHIQAMKDGRVRLIIVLLGDVITDEGMDDELRAYLTTNTYIKWGDPRFWDKLRYALPHRGRDEGRTRAGGEEVLRLVRPTDPPIILRPIPSHTLAIEFAHKEEVEV